MPVVFIIFILQLLTSTIAAPTFLNLTAISAVNGESTLECWQLSNPFTVSNQAGTTGTAVQQLGNVANASYAIIPAQFNGGVHCAPAVQYVAFLSGLAHITLPNSKQEAWIHGGQHGLIIAADTAAVSKEGHITKYPSKKETTALQIPTAEEAVPEHIVLHEGACQRSEVHF
ncbi:MAG: hypothetical protein M1830_006573 [Pleopsidium flavum]|nr:MAG: hypothetical protein M1830_006573 [Pleopsidium flavum]